MYNIVLTNYGNTQISNKVILDGVILLSDYISNISTVTSVTGYSVKLDIQARGNVKDKIGNILIRDDSTNTYTAKTILFYKNVNSEKKIIAGFSQNSAIINKLNKAINLFLSFDFSVFTNGFQFALVQAGFSQASQNVDGLVHIEDPNVDFDDSYSVYSKVQIDNKLSSYAQTSDIPTKTSQLDNDSNFINQHQSIKTINSQSLVGTGNITISQGEYNKINTISVNSTNQIPDSNKNVNITVPTKVSQLDNDLGFITSGVVPTNYVTVNTAQDITAAKTFKNAADTTKIDGKEIVISGTETYNVSGAGAGTDYPNSPSSVTATTEIKIDHNTISCNGNSIGYYRNYYATPNQSSDPAYVSYNDGIEIKSNSYDSIWCNNSLQHEWYSLTITSKDPYAHGRNYIEGLAFSTDIIRDNYVGDLNNGKEVLFAISKDGAYFNKSVDFNKYAHFYNGAEFSSAFVNQDDLNIYTDESNTYAASETIKDYVKQASLFYNRTSSVITATSETVIEPSSNNAISLGTSTNKFSNIYATTFNGDLSGNASSATHADSADFADMADAAASADYATKATQDGNGNTISSYYCTLSTEQTISGKKIFNGGNVDFVLGDNTRNISFRYSPTYTSWTWITCYNGTDTNSIKLHFTNNNTDVIQLTHTCTSESVNNIQKVKSLVTTPSVDNVWQLGALNKRLSNIYTTELSLTSYAVTNGTYHPRTLSTGNYGIHSNADICPISTLKNNLGNEQCRWSRIYVGFVGSYDYPVESTYTKDLYLPSGSNSNLVSLPDYLTGSYDNSGSFTTGVAANVGAIRLLYVEIPANSSVNKWVEPGTQITNKNFGGFSYMVGIAAFHIEPSNGYVQIRSDFNNVTGTWRMLSAVWLNSTNKIYNVPFLAIRVA